VSPLVMPVLSLLVDLFKRRRTIKGMVLPMVEAANGIPNHEERREAVVKALLVRGFEESEARLLVEAGVRLWKKYEKKRLKKAAKLKKRDES
jgi:hypothetical protein